MKMFRSDGQQTDLTRSLLKSTRQLSDLRNLS